MNKKNYQNFGILAILFITLFVVGCTKKEAKDSIIKNIKESDMYIDFANANMIFENGADGTLPFLRFSLVTTSSINADAITIDGIEKKWYSVEVNEVKKQTLPSYVYYSYNGLNWETYNGKASEKEKLAYLTRIAPNYEKIKEENIAPNAKYYTVTIGFEEGGNYTFEKITIHSKNVKKTFSIGNVEVNASKQSEVSNVYDSNQSGFLLNQYVDTTKIIPNTKGDIKLNPIAFIATKNVTIQDIQIRNDKCEIVDANVQIGQKTYDLRSKAVQVLANEEGSIQLHINDTQLATKLDYATLLYITMHIQSEDGTVYPLTYCTLVKTTPSFAQMVVANRDGVDFSSYYYDYFGKEIFAQNSSE